MKYEYICFCFFKCIGKQDNFKANVFENRYPRWRWAFYDGRRVACNCFVQNKTELFIAFLVNKTHKSKLLTGISFRETLTSPHSTLMSPYIAFSGTTYSKMASLARKNPCNSNVREKHSPVEITVSVVEGASWTLTIWSCLKSDDVVEETVVVRNISVVLWIRSWGNPSALASVLPGVMRCWSLLLEMCSPANDYDYD